MPLSPDFSRKGRCFPPIFTLPLTGLLTARPEILIMPSFEREAAVLETGPYRTGAVLLMESPKKPVVAPIEYRGFHVFHPPEKVGFPESPESIDSLFTLPERDGHLKDWLLDFAEFPVERPLDNHHVIRLPDHQVVNIGELSVAVMTIESFERSLQVPIQDHFIRLPLKHQVDVLVVSGLMESAVLQRFLRQHVMPCPLVLVYQTSSEPGLTSWVSEKHQPQALVGLTSASDGYVKISIEISEESPRERLSAALRVHQPRLFRNSLRDLGRQRVTLNKIGNIGTTLYGCYPGLHAPAPSTEDGLAATHLAAVSALSDYIGHLHRSGGGSLDSKREALETALDIIESEAPSQRREALHVFARLFHQWFGGRPGMAAPYR